MPEAQQPTVGRIVHYVLNADSAKFINDRRAANGQRGNDAQAGDELPLIVVRVWPDEGGPGVDGVNGQVLLDGPDNLWVTSALPSSGPVPGCWHWPERA